jgi:hypothetical protein
MTDSVFPLQGDSDPEELDTPEAGTVAAATEDESEPADLYDEGGVVTAGLTVAPPEHGAEDTVRL